jgi:hypothetical protein
MGLLNLTESERIEILNLHNNAKIIKEQAAPAPAAAPATVEDVVKEIQKTLNTKYGGKLTVDGKWGNLTQTALETAIKSKSATPAASTTTAPATGTATPAASTTTAPATGTATPAASTTTAPATQGADEFGAEAPQPQLATQSQQALSGQLTPQQIRQQGRFDQRLARQARRNTRRAGQQ